MSQHTGAMNSHGQIAGGQEVDSAGSQHARLESSQRSDPPVIQEHTNPAGVHEQPSGDSAVFDIAPMEALKMFSAHLGNLVQITGDVPPTTLMAPTSASSESLESSEPRVAKDNASSKATKLHWSGAESNSDGATPPGTVQQNVLAKRFYSKKAPPISLEDYLLRLHKYCPMSTAVYLATSLYITRMAMVEKIILVTPRNVHRLVLAGLRVAMKALEDLSYPHSRFARVGGVSERELTRLEITFCFLTDFELRVDAHMLMGEAKFLRSYSERSRPDMTLDTRQLGEGRDDSALIASTSAPKEIAAGAPDNP
ncbi:hypothetical protein VTN96DRAFT_8611 [Rasamsonia emersonii]|uniref:Cyclin-dependent protein kinase complex component n=1 Tax=Rasamsonia emersonii (strain ATCC 16479 / CBS 393.64 / IMI 116815) TaxID=1408163 RepID=A0A0F4YSQ5_RASE3|nr:Cyclin-dependent protein kinase complex component [Rasamsonia emersonii CBS 393.64]KKA20886.1 Cyclin-dependent protein kinase complex component [Rasamsonia emersonii CBS 393.64]